MQKIDAWLAFFQPIEARPNIIADSTVSPHRPPQPLPHIPKNVLNVLQPDRYPNHVRQHPRSNLLSLIQLTMRRARRVRNQRARIPNVHQVAHELRAFDEAHARLHSALHAKGQQA